MSVVNPDGPKNWVSTTPQEWVGHLQGINSNSTSPHKIIVRNKKSMGIEVVDPKDLTTGKQKLLVKTIVEISTEQLEKIKTSYSEDKIDLHQANQLIKDISEMTQQIINLRVEKRDQPFKKVGRGVALLLSAAASLALVGIPFFRRLLRSDREFKQEIKTMQEGLKSQVAEVRSFIVEDKVKECVLINDERKKAEVVTKIKDFILSIPEKLNEQKAEITNEKNQSDLQWQINADLEQKSYRGIECVAGFAKDFAGTVTIERNDGNIKDKQPMPSDSNLEGLERVKVGINLINDMIQTAADEPWRAVLQSAASQTSINAAFNDPKIKLNQESQAISWEEGKDAWNIQATINQPPIFFEIIRDKAGNIEKVNIKVDGFMDITKLNVGATDTPSTPLISNAIKVNLKYSITLSDDQKLVISDFKSDYVSNI